VHPSTNYAAQSGVDVDSPPEETKISPAECNDKPAINENMNYLTFAETRAIAANTTNAGKVYDSKFSNMNYLTADEISNVISAKNSNTSDSTNYLQPDEMYAAHNSNVFQTNYLLPDEVARVTDSDSESDEAVTRQSVNYLTRQEVDALDGDSDPKLEMKLGHDTNASNFSNNPSHASTATNRSNCRSVLYLQPSEIQFSDDEDEPVFGAARLHVPKLALPISNQSAPAKKGNDGYFESVPSQTSVRSATSSATLVTARTPNYAGQATLTSLQSARDELEDSCSDDESDVWSDARVQGVGVNTSDSVPASSAPNDSSDMYWNNEYQHVLAMPECVEKYQRLSRLAQDFVYAAQVSESRDM